jgi:lipopolysaccharide/colanic/teichoic acid biosynthesis glycosyltransferase
MSFPLREFGKTKIQYKSISVECVQTRPQSYVVSEASGGSTTLLPQDPTAYYAEPSLWSLSLAKRCVDLLFASVALLLFWPLFLVTALFTVFKFRTMAIAGQNEGPSLTKRGDPRVTRIGRFLRKYKLDELPQLFNVLLGQMSVVGPRPKLPHLEVMRMPFRPGLTGAATLAFRREEEMLQDIPDDDLEAYYCRMIKPLKAKIDWDYMRKATLSSDFALLYETACCCVSARSNSGTVDYSESA